MLDAWKVIVALCEDGGFGDLIIESENGAVRRGPINSMRIVSPNRDEVDGRTKVVINTFWMAVLGNPDGVWRNARVRESQTIVTTISVQDAPTHSNYYGAGAIQVRIPGTGTVSLLLKESEGSLLHPKDVRGLTEAEMRASMAHRYGLPGYTPWEEIIEKIGSVHDRVSLGYARTQCMVAANT